MVAVLGVLAASLLLQEQSSVELRRGEGSIDVLVDGSLMTTLHYGDVARPYLYPFHGPTGVQLLRNYPFVEGVEGEARDHPHHTGIWFAHGDVDGVDFWTRRGSMKSLREPLIEGATVTLNLVMRGPEDELVGSCGQRITFGAIGDRMRFVDYDVQVQPIRGRSLILGDTKEGTMAIRTHPNLKLVQPDELKGRLPVGSAVNSEGVTGRQVWGKRAAWVDYWGEVDGSTVGIALFDHPENPRHPTWWHARDYGLFAANPFGVSDFEGEEAGNGDMIVAAGESVRFRYRFLFHLGDNEQADVSGEFERWSRGDER